MKNICMIIGALFIGYLFILMPRFTKRKELEKYKGRYYAHRGLHDNKTALPENSLPAFVNAVAHDYGIELDVQPTKDGKLVVFHDETLERVCGQKGKVSEYAYDELREFRLLDTDEKIPTFAEVLGVVDGKVPLIVEMKMYATDPKVCELLDKELSAYGGDFCVESFNPLAVRWYKKNRPDVVRGQLSSALNKESDKKDAVFFLVEHLLTNIITRPDFIAYNHKFKDRVSRKICRSIFRCFGVTWTVKTQEELECVKNDFDIFIFEGFIPTEGEK